MEEEQKEIPDYLRPWFPTQEDLDRRLDGLVDARTAWLHFEPLWTSLGYSICYGTVRECRPRTPLVDQDATGSDPFQPNATGPFVHSGPVKLEDSMFKYFPARGWLLDSPRLTYAYDKLNRLVVIKAMRLPESRSELEIITYLNSPALRSSPKNHTIPILKQVEAEGWHFLIMPAWNMSCSPPFFTWQVDDYFTRIIQSLEGLTFMHDHGVAHRDISRSNVVFNQDGSVFVPIRDVQPVISTWNVRLAFIDFGISQKYSLDTDPDTWVSSHCEGTGIFMAPEVVSIEESPGSYKVLPADVYALAGVWNELIEWERTLVKICEEKPPARTIEISVYALQVLEKHVPEYTKLLGEMMDADPARRPTAASALHRFETMRDATPAHIRFAPAEGYPADII